MLFTSACNLGDTKVYPIKGKTDVGVDVETDAAEPECVHGSECASGVCNAAGECALASCDDQVINGGETDLDCGGNCAPCADTKGCADASDCASGYCGSDNTCKAPSCSDNVQNGVESDIDCGGNCAPCADTKNCNAHADCESAICDQTSGRCIAVSCTDSALNGDETDIDCGGNCASCADGKQCEVAGDCQSGICDNNTCEAPSCDDDVQNGSETAVDCGGSCLPCDDGRRCESESDCRSLVCEDNLCEPASCDDAVKNGNESDVDCAGSCAPCAANKACTHGSNCVSGVCGSNNTCSAASCTDTVQNGSETSVDCGGSCGPCADGAGCATRPDCTSGICGQDNTCQAPSCTDTVQNGSETGVDCGGNCAPCADNQGCILPGDCISGRCANNTCQTPTCNDTVKNGTETDVDCGGNCATKCAANQGCSQGSDCTTNVCSTTGQCISAACNDGTKNGNETDVDCGGSCAPCAAAKVCLGPNDCQSNVCTGNICQAPTCSDGVKNGNEVNVDCGGSCAGCAHGQACTDGADCVSGFCTSGTCYTPTSCQDIAQKNLATANGTYVIDPDGPTQPYGAVSVYCDLTTDFGAGYTMVRRDSNTLGSDPAAYKTSCTSIGMEMIVPRTYTHLKAITAWNNNLPPNVVNIYPKTNGAVGLNNWQGICKGSPCEFYMSDANTMCNGAVAEPNGDNTTASFLYRSSASPLCEFGVWNDAPATQALPAGADYRGWVICSTNDAKPAPRRSCQDYRQTDTVFNAGVEGINGPYPLRAANGTNYNAYCDMTRHGGGWTLALKANGTLGTFAYDQGIWTNNTLLANNNPGFDREQGKFQSFLDLPYTQILVGLETPIGTSAVPSPTYLPIATEGASLQATFLTAAQTPFKVGRQAWMRTMPTGQVQSFCNAEGFNVRTTSDGSRVRIGLLGNNEDNCSSPDSRIGIGAAGSTCSLGNFSVGNNSGCNTAAGLDRNTAAFGYVWVRDIPVYKSCKELLAAGYKRSGIYPLDTDGIGGKSSFNAYCDMETAGGGWTLATIHGNNGRPGTRIWDLWDNSYPRPGASHYGPINTVDQSLALVRAGTNAGVVQYSINAGDIYATSGTNREFLAFVGGSTRNYITGTLKGSCNYFNGATRCGENVAAQMGMTVYRADGTVLTQNAQACTSAASDAFNEFGLHIIDGTDTSTHICHQSASMLGHQQIGRIYSTFNSSNGNYWNTGVHSHWNATSTTDQAGYLFIR
ncbi:MAG: hypothetical protein H0U74_06285 [Bradymonadaceae bacterium]|nr:hypothetical protein [Lujinxingiaceae bacterium]